MSTAIISCNTHLLKLELTLITGKKTLEQKPQYFQYSKRSHSIFSFNQAQICGAHIFRSAQLLQKLESTKKKTFF